MADAKAIFDKTIERAFKQLELYEKHHSTMGEDLSDLIRSALVLGVSAFDAYFTNKFCDKLVPYLKKYTVNQALADYLTECGVTHLMLLELLKEKIEGKTNRPFRKIRTRIENKLEGFVTQRFDAIDNLFLKMNLKGLSQNVEKKAKKTKLKTNIQSAIERRHNVVHNGDLNSHSKLQKIDAKKIRRNLENIKIFINNSEDIINNKVK